MSEHDQIKPGSLGTVEDKLFIAPDDKTTVSRSKLEHIKDMAGDERMQEIDGLDNKISVLSQGLFFTSLGSILSFDALSSYGKYLSVAGLSVGFVLGLYCWHKISSESKKRTTYRSKLVEKINEIIKQMDNTCATHSRKES